MVQWYAVLKNGVEIFQGYLDQCKRVVKNSENSHKISNSIAIYEIKKIKYEGVKR